MPLSRDAGGSSQICHVWSFLKRSMAKGSRGRESRGHSCFLEADGFTKSTQKVGCSLDSRQDLRILSICQQKMRGVKGNFRISGVFPY